MSIIFISEAGKITIASNLECWNPKQFCNNNTNECLQTHLASQIAFVHHLTLLYFSESYASANVAKVFSKVKRKYVQKVAGLVSERFVPQFLISLLLLCIFESQGLGPFRGLCSAIVFEFDWGWVLFFGKIFSTCWEFNFCYFLIYKRTFEDGGCLPLAARDMLLELLNRMLSNYIFIFIWQKPST